MSGIKQNWLPLTILLVIWAVFFSRTLFLGKYYFLDDLKILYYPLEYVYGEFQSNWQLPQWSPLFGFGQPLLAWGQLGFFTPLHLLLRFFGLPPLVLLQVSILSYFALGLTGMFVFLRRRALRGLAAALGAIVFTFSGFSVGHLNHVNFYVATMVLPWLLLAIDAFVSKPTLRRAAIMAAVAAVIPLSGHAQIALYTLIIAGLYGFLSAASGILRADFEAFLAWFPRQGGGQKGRNLGASRWASENERAGYARGKRYTLKITALTILAAILSLSLASFAILPLFEFLPYSDRAEALSPEELFEFSYPPAHAITLIFPYFFGDHESYWGAKNFQELAAYVGIIPLLLTGAALTRWQTQRTLRLTGTLLILLGIAGALGIHSPVYRWLVGQNIITSLSIPARFLLFFDAGLALLAALGLHDLTISVGHTQKISRLLIVTTAGLTLAAILLTPFFRQASDDPNLIKRFALLPTTLVILAFSVLLWLFSQLSYRRPIARQIIPFLILTATSLTLLYYGWQYNPLTTSYSLAQPASIYQPLAEYAFSHNTPPRLLSRPALLVNKQQATAHATVEISPRFTVHQPFTITKNTLECLLVPMYSLNRPASFLTITLRDNLYSPPLNQITLSSRDIDNYAPQKFCFPELANHAGQSYLLSFSSDQPSGVNLYFKLGPIPEPERAYLVRIANPSPQQTAKSLKDVRIIFDAQYRTRSDPEVANLSRHLQVTAGASSTDWIGAFGIRAYRTFVRQYFANDRDPLDNEGKHFLQRYRDLINMSGVTHVSQTIPFDATDNLPAAGFVQLAKQDIGSTDVALYSNPSAYPKSFLVPDKPTSPTLVQTPIPEATATITQYEPTKVSIEVDTPRAAYLVLTDAWTPQWHALLDGQPAPSLVANTIWRAAAVPAGQHTVTFYYRSPAIKLAKKLTTLGLVTFLALITIKKSAKCSTKKTTSL